MKKYKYFISFTANGMSEIGNSECVLDHQIKSIKDIRAIEKALIEGGRLSNCVLITYKLLDIEVIQ